MKDLNKNFKPALIMLLPLLAVSACANKQERQLASGGFKYVKVNESKTLQVPNDVDTPTFSDQYKLPEVGENAPQKLVGNQLKVSSPRLVLPIVTGSHVTEGSKTATVWFDKVDDSQPLDQTIWNSLIAFLDDQGIGVDTFDRDNNRLVTDWMLIRSADDESWYDWTTTESETGKRFEFTLELKAHGRSAALNVELVDYLKSMGKDVIADIDQLTERQEEVEILNQVINYYDYQIRVNNSNKIKQIRQGLNTEMGFNADGDPAFVVDAKYAVAWPRTLLVLRKLGFNVKDLDQSNGLLFVNYAGSQKRWWENWFSEDTKFELDEKPYRLKVKRLGDKTSITFMDDESKPFTAKQVSDLYAAFAEVMAEDNLDI